jgi:hypothetical protein
MKPSKIITIIGCPELSIPLFDPKGFHEFFTLRDNWVFAWIIFLSELSTK